ncbi:hypothetical protein H5181_07545 [Shewanella sp. SG44-2]|uniref:hypothetical protein n=1 Tax=Shewanella sp. SG44-2 TaxID=2760962 RepID=UPI0016047BC2|nr:hypothetical protein [Shewanella sp. SG44-2]MBB1426316.1 hypothetical protein [Shewanella sp. SG44-2]
MEFKDLLPIVGVALGWGLSELGGFIKFRATKARSVKQAIATLYKLNFDMLQVKLAQEYYKNNSSDLEDWERGRNRSFEKYLNLPEAAIVKVNESITLISQEYPLLAFRLDGAISQYMFIKNRNLNSFVDDKKVYMKMLTGFEVSQLGAQHIVEKIIFSLAFKVDLILWINLKLDMRKYKKGIKQGDLIHSSQVFSTK